MSYKSYMREGMKGGGRPETVETVPSSVVAEHTCYPESFRGEKRGVNETRRSCAARHMSGGARSGFTMIEIAISLAVIGFALVAIIGILPQGMTVQKENRQETIINQDFNMFMEAIRNGGRGFDDLTNYVFAITNYWTIYSDSAPPASHVDAHIYNGAWRDGTANGNWISNGMRIVGLLSTPRYIDTTPLNSKAIFFRSNYIVAYVRSMSGQAGEKFPQTNTIMQDLAFGYRLMPEIAPYTYYEPDWTNYGAYLKSANTNDWVSRSNYWRIASTVQTNLCDMRLTFRWPSFPNGKVGNDRQIFRTVAGGHLLLTNDLPNNQGMPLWFFEPRTYVKAKLP